MDSAQAPMCLTAFVFLRAFHGPRTSSPEPRPPPATACSGGDADRAEDRGGEAEDRCEVLARGRKGVRDARGGERMEREFLRSSQMRKRGSSDGKKEWQRAQLGGTKLFGLASYELLQSSTLPSSEDFNSGLGGRVRLCFREVGRRSNEERFMCPS